MTLKNDALKCDCTVIHQNVIDEVKAYLPQETQLNELASLFKVFGDPTRVKLLSALFKAEMCVCDLAVLLDMTQSSISHQLAVLKQARLVKNRRDGKVVYYSLDDAHIQHIFDQGLLHIAER